MLRLKLPLVVLAAILPTVFSAVAWADDVPADLAGSYKCSGTSNGGGKYEGTVEITKMGDTYQLEWVVGGEKYSGIGILDKDKSLLSTSWALPAEGGVVTGVAIYKIEKDKLVGRWAAFPGDGKVYDEVMTRVF